MRSKEPLGGWISELFDQSYDWGRNVASYLLPSGPVRVPEPSTGRADPRMLTRWQRRKYDAIELTRKVAAARMSARR